MTDIVRQTNINKLSESEQLSFYKKEFRVQHCELDGCGNEVRDKWVQYEGSLYCESCFEWLIEEEKEAAQNEIVKYEKEIEKLKSRFNL